MLRFSGVFCCLLALTLCSPCSALVEPEVDAWHQIVSQVDDAFPFPGGSMLGEAAGEVGRVTSKLAAAPLADLMAELELRRGLKFKYFTPWHVKDRTALRAFIREELEEEYPPEKAAQEEALLEALGLVPPDFHIAEFMEGLLTEQVAGAYDPNTDQFFLVDVHKGQGFLDSLGNKASSALFGDTNAVVIIHELDHALGGQHFPLKEMFKRISKTATLDESTAVSALVEGDATFVMMDYQAKKPASSQGAETMIQGADMLTDLVLNHQIPFAGMGEFSQAPLFFKKSLIFPYLNGAEFISTIKLYGEGWEDVNAAYADLPTSTEDIIHPGNYQWQSQPPAVPDFSKMPVKFGPWRRVDDQTGGEFLVRVVLEQYGVEGYREAAEGWNGDRIRVFRHEKTGALGFYWAVRWDSKREAEEFDDSLGSHLPFVVEKDGDLTLISLAFTPPELKRLRKTISSR